MIVAQKIKDVKIGDVIALDRVREIGTPSFILQGNPFIDPQYFDIRATVVEHQITEFSNKHQQRSGHSKTKRGASHYTLLRISEMKIKKENE